MARHKYQGTFKDGNGRVVGAVTTANSTDGVVYVYLAGGTTAADVYAASSGGTAVNSVETNDYGFFEFWVDDTEYASSQLFKISLTHANFETKTYDNLILIPHSMTHIASDGSDHTFIDQSVISGATPTFTGTNFTNVPMAGIKAADKTGDDADLVTGTAGDANDFLMWNADGDAVGSGIAQSEIDYAEVTGNDGATDVTAAELEELTDGSTTTKHNHAAWTYTAQTATTTGTTVVLTTAIPSTAVEFEVILNGVSTDANSEPPIVQFGDAGGYETADYVTSISKPAGGEDDTNGFYSDLVADYSASEAVSCVMRFVRWDSSEHLWHGTISAIISGENARSGFGTKTTSAALTSVRLNTPSGTDAFNAGEARVRYR